MNTGKETKGAQELAESFPFGQMLGCLQCPTATTEKIDDIGETEERS